MLQLRSLIPIRRRWSTPPSYHLLHGLQESKKSCREMDPEIWKRLPVEILDRILSFLPLNNFLRLRSTCKHFYALVFSPVFLLMHASRFPDHSCFSSFLLLSHPQLYHMLRLYDFEIGSWKDVPLLLTRFPTSKVSSSVNLLSSSNGLLCFANSSSFLVCNALTMSLRVIQFPHFPFTFESFNFISTPSCYKILVLRSRHASDSNLSLVYESKTNSWTKFSGTGLTMGANLLQDGVFFKGAFYFTTVEPFAVVSFHVTKGKWEEQGSELPPLLTFARLVADGDEKLRLVGGVGRNGISRSIRVWELSREGRRWIEVERLPEPMCRKLLTVCYHYYDHVYCFWHQGMICLCCYNWPEILYYHVGRRIWRWLPRCPALPEKWSCGFKWFSFSPQIFSLA